MTIALASSNRFYDFARRQIRNRLSAANQGGIRWARVVSLPALLLVSMTLCGVLIAAHTGYIEADTERLSAQPDQYFTQVAAN